MMLKKLIKNNLVALMFLLPNVGINLAVQLILDVHYGWTGYLSILAWLIGGGLSFEFGVLLAMMFKSNFKVGRWRYSYAHKED